MSFNENDNFQKEKRIISNNKTENAKNYHRNEIPKNTKTKHQKHETESTNTKHRKHASMIAHTYEKGVLYKNKQISARHEEWLEAGKRRSWWRVERGEEEGPEKKELL